MKKRICGIILVMAMLLSLVPCVYAYEKPTSGSCGPNVSWSFSNGVLRIYGNGDMQTDYDSYQYYYMEDAQSVIIQDGVTSINEYAFSGYENLRSIRIPSTVISIGENAFGGCTKLEAVDYYGYDWDSISIGNGNSELTIAKKIYESSTNIVDSGDCGENGSDLSWSFGKDKVLTISGTGKMQDYGWDSDAEIKLPDQPWKDYMSRIEKVVIEPGVTATGYAAFEGAENLTEAVIPEGFVNLAWCTFNNCAKLTNVKLPESLTRIGDGAFGGCRSITSITIPENVTFIDVRAFRGTSISSIHIPKNVSYIGGCAFIDCKNLLNITVDPDNKDYIVENGVLFSKDKATLIVCPQTKTGASYVIPNTVKMLYDGAFKGCSFEKITIPQGIQSIGYESFMECKNLVSVVIPDGVTIIGQSAFNDCDSLTSVSIPASVEQIYQYAFNDYSGNHSLKDVYYGGTKEQWEKIRISNGNAAIDSDKSATIHYSSTAPSPAPDNPLYTVSGNDTIFHVPVTIRQGNVKIEIRDKDGNVIAKSDEIRFESLPETGRVDVSVPCVIKVGDIIWIGTRNRDVY